MSNENTPNPPALRFKDEVALWPTKEGDKAALSGYITLDGQKLQVRGFINDTDKEGNKLKSPYLALTHNGAAEGEPAQWKNIAYGNAVNSRRDGKEVFFDQVIFNVAGSEKTFSAYAGRGMTDDLHGQLGFTSPQVQRPEKAPAAEAEAEEEEAAAAPRP